jgi:hypothetical protein
MTRMLAIVTILLSATVIAAAVTGDSPARLAAQACETAVLAMNTNQAPSRVALPESRLGTVSEPRSPISQDLGNAQAPTPLDNFSGTRVRSADLRTVLGRLTAEEEGEEEEDGEEEEKEGEEDEEGDEGGWDRLWDAPKLG